MSQMKTLTADEVVEVAHGIFMCNPSTVKNALQGRDELTVLDLLDLNIHPSHRIHLSLYGEVEDYVVLSLRKIVDRVVSLNASGFASNWLDGSDMSFSSARSSRMAVMAALEYLHLIESLKGAVRKWPYRAVKVARNACESHADAKLELQMQINDIRDCVLEIERCSIEGVAE